MPRKEYAIYKGDEFLFVGDIYQCSRYLNVKKETIRFMSYPAYKKRINENSQRLDVIVLERESEEFSNNDC